MNYHYLEFEVTLLEVPSHLWRRFLLRHTFSFEELHFAIQMACGWQEYHLFEFRHEDRVLASDMHDEEPDGPLANEVPLKRYFNRPGKECLYLYDFGDGWRHRVRLVQNVAVPNRFVQCLTAGEGMFPPEDCGGAPGYEECVRACMMTSAEIEQLDEVEQDEVRTLRQWLDDWRPEGFDLEKVKSPFRR